SQSKERRPRIPSRELTGLDAALSLPYETHRTTKQQADSAGFRDGGDVQVPADQRSFSSGRHVRHEQGPGAVRVTSVEHIQHLCPCHTVKYRPGRQRINRTSVGLPCPRELPAPVQRVWKCAIEVHVLAGLIVERKQG